MPSRNLVLLQGHLTRDPELKYTQNGTALCNFGLAINTRFGENKEQVCFLDVTVWEKQGEVCTEHLKKGSAVDVEGRLTMSQWEKDGVKHSRLFVTARRVQFLSHVGKGARDGDGRTGEEREGERGSDTASDDAGEMPF